MLLPIPAPIGMLKIPESVAGRLAARLGAKVVGQNAERLVVTLSGGAVVNYGAVQSGTNITVTITGFAFGKLIALRGLLSAAKAEGAETLTIVGEQIVNEQLGRDLLDHGFVDIGGGTLAKTFDLR
jgi:hypothetical protein